MNYLLIYKIELKAVAALSVATYASAPHKSQSSARLIHLRKFLSESGYPNVLFIRRRISARKLTAG